MELDKFENMKEEKSKRINGMFNGRTIYLLNLSR